jgi:hypothetical protein
MDEGENKKERRNKKGKKEFISIQRRNFSESSAAFLKLAK